MNTKNNEIEKELKDILEWYRTEDFAGQAAMHILNFNKTDEAIAQIQTLIANREKKAGEEAFTHMVKADLTEFIEHSNDEQKKSFFNGANAMLTVFNRYLVQQEDGNANNI